MKRQMAGFLADPSFAVEFVHMDATFPAKGPPDQGIRTFFPGEAYYEWWDRAADGQYVGLDETLTRVAEVLRTAEPPFDAVMGFSQGAMLASTVACLATLPAGSPHHDARFYGKLRFAVLCAGFCPRDPRLIDMFSETIRIPSLHIWGAADPMAASSSALSQKFSQDEVMLHLHTGGHVVPRLPKGSDGDVRVEQFFKRFATASAQM